MDEAILCPYCGEELDISIDEFGGSAQDYIEDCAVCCRPIKFMVAVDGEGEVSMAVKRIDD